MTAATLERPPDTPQMSATCPRCGSTNTHRVQVKDGGKVVRVYFECLDCGNVW